MTLSTAAESLRGLLPDFYFVNTSAAQMEHHHALLARLPQEGRLIEFLRQPRALLTELSLCAYDDARPGLLAKLCGTLMALGVNVQTASVFTIRDPAQPEAGIVLDTLLLSEPYRGHERRLRGDKEDEIREALAQVLDRHLPVTYLLSRMPLRPRWPMRVHEVEAEVAPLPEQIALTMRVSRHSMAVFRMAAAIAALDLNTQTAQIHLAGDGVHGLFFVTGPAQCTQALASELRTALQTNAMPPALASAA